MKIKMIVTVTVAVVLVGGAIIFAPRQLSAQTNSVNAAGHKILYYTCPMHPSVKSDKPGDCPICKMELLPVYADETKTNVPATSAGCCPTGTNAAPAASDCCQ
jgi:hypothetical protein